MKKIFAILSIVFTFLSCSKDEEPIIAPELPVNIHIVGKATETVNGTNRAVVWTNGVATFLSGTNQDGLAKAIVISNNISYIVGYITNANNRTQGTFWKNKVAQSINVDTTVNTNFLSISIYNNDVYILGTSNGQTRYWKNGVENTPLGIENATPIKIIVNQNGVYILVNDNNRAKLWKDGTTTTFSNSTTNGEFPKDFCINNNDIYVVAEEISTGIKYWKNGVVKYITATSYIANAESINVINDAVCISGSDDNRKAVYWTNGIPTVLGDAGSNSVVWASTVFNGNLYSAGFNNYQMAVWKNNTSITPTLSTIDSDPHGIFITN